MFKSRLDKFILKRAAALFFVLATADIAFSGVGRWMILAGLSAGAIISTGRLCSNEWLFKKIFRLNQSDGKRAAAGSMAAFTISQLVLIPVIVLAYLLSVWALYGFIAGILIIPIVIMINSITEAFGITKNNFE